ncbi:MAG: hypothetical protein R2845_13075 [Thermomicrobiales bacterium]
MVLIAPLISSPTGGCTVRIAPFDRGDDVGEVGARQRITRRIECQRRHFTETAARSEIGNGHRKTPDLAGTRKQRRSLVAILLFQVLPSAPTRITGMTETLLAQAIGAQKFTKERPPDPDAVGTLWRLFARRTTLHGCDERLSAIRAPAWLCNWRCNS